MISILIIDDNETMREGMAAVVSRQGSIVHTAASGSAGLDLFRKHRHDLVISDIKMEGMDGMAVLEAIRKEEPESLIILVTAFGSVEIAVQAMKLGAFDFLTKPFKPEVLRMRVRSAMEVLHLRQDRVRLKDENASLRQQLVDQIDRVDDLQIIGDAESFRRSLEHAAKIARTDSSVLITGESGTGKELVARALHLQSPRCDGPFVRVNCGALTETLLESELFGHEKGSFTGATRRKLGRFELADGGTIFLDEIGDITPALQIKLLRVLQEHEFDRVGGDDPIKVNVRVISATNKDLLQESEAGRFREDLYYRLHVVPLHLPPLRERLSDIPLLVDHFIKKLSARTRTRAVRFAKEALAVLRDYHWPGNVRELENVVEQTLVFADEHVITVADLPPHLRKNRSGCSPPADLALGDRPLPDLLDDLEKTLILKAYQSASGVKTETARLLGIKTSALYYKLEKYGIGEQEG